MQNTEVRSRTGSYGAGHQQHTGIAFAYVLASIVLMGVIAIAGLRGWQMLSMQSTAVQHKAQNRDLLQQDVLLLSQSASDSDSDGVLEAPAYKTGTFVPTGGGNLPDTSAAVKNDAYGRLLGYCSWDHGNVTNSTNRTTGDNSPLQSDVVFAVISAGADGVFQTTCANIKAGVTSGDDEVRAVTLAEVRKAVGGNIFMGEPVASQSALSSINSPVTGEMHLAKDTNTLYQWNGSSWQSIGGSGSSGTQPGKNLLDNGNFDIWQRGTSFSVSTTASLTADRWKAFTSSGTVTASQQLMDLSVSTRPAFATYLLQVSATNPAPIFTVEEPVFGVTRFSNQTVTFSYWARTTNGTYQVTPCYDLNYGTDFIFTDPTPSASTQTCASAVTLTTSWQRLSQTFTIPNQNGKTLGTNGNDYIAFGLKSNASVSQAVVVQYAQMQVEGGTSMTNYDLRPVGQELYECMRYYEIFTSTGTASSPDYTAYSDGTGNPAIRNIYYRVKKRGTPVVTLIGTAKGNNICAVASNTYNDSSEGFQLGITPCSAGTFTLAQSWSADAD